MNVTVRIAAIAAMFAASTATAAVGNLESYHLRHDFSTGARVALLGPQCTADFIVTGNETAVAGPNGAANAVHPTHDNWGAVKRNGSNVSDDYLSKNDWTVALCLYPGSTEKGVLFAVGRQNTTNGRSAISLCSSSDPTQLYVYDTRKSGKAAVETGHETITGLSNMTNGFHTVVMSYAKASSNLTVYVDGVKKVTHQIGGGNKSYYIGEGLEYCQTMSYMPSFLTTTWGSDSDASFYDMRFYFGAFNDSDARAYAALYPADRMGSPFRPSAYVESSATNTAANAVVGNCIDTGYRAKGATTRFTADYQFVDLRGQQRIFGARSTEFTQGLYINGTAASGGKLAWNFMNTASWVSMGVDAVRSRQIAAFDRVGKTIAVTNYADRAQFYYNATHAELTNTTSDATTETYLFAENDSGAKNYGKARIYSFEADEGGTPVLFLTPDIENGEAGVRDIITGTFHGDGNKNNNPERTLRFYDGVGRASDYKYENDTLYAKLYATSGENGAVSVAGGAAAASVEGWVPRGGTLVLAAVSLDSDKYEFGSWIGDTWAIADGYSVTNASIEIATPYAVQLRATFKPTVNAQLTIAADGADAVNWSVADWRNIDNSEEAISAPVDKNVTIVAHKSFTLTLDMDVALSNLTVQADANCVVTLAKGDGSLVTVETIVESGVLRQGSASVLGTTSLVTVENGGTFDVNNLAADRSTVYSIAGAGAGDWPWALTSSVNVTDDHNSIDIVSLADNATIGGNVQICIGVRSGATFNPTTETLPLTLNGHTLTKTGTGTLWFRRPYSTNEGTIDVQSGALRVTGWNNTSAAYGQSCVSNIALIAREGTTAKNELNYTLYFKTLDLCGGALTSSSGAFGMSAGETLAGHGTAEKLTMADGAVATLDGDLSVTTTLTAEGALSFARKTGVETNVTVFVPGTFATASNNIITVGEGVILDIGINRPEATLAVNAAGVLALRLKSYEDSPVLNVSANPANLIVYKPDGITDIASGCTVEYDADAGTITITPPIPVWTNADGTGSFESVANWDSGEVPANGSSICVSNATDVIIAVSSAHAYDYVTVNGGATLSFNGSGSLTVGALAFYDGTEVKTGGVVVPASFNGTGDLVLESGNGAEYSVTGASTLTGKLTIKATASFTNTLSAAVSVTNMTVEAGENVVVTVANATGGSFLSDEIIVAGGVLQQGSATVFGSTPKVTVKDGGTFDVNGFAPSRTTTFLIAGAGAGDWPWALTSSAATDAKKSIDILELSDNATVGGDFQICVGVRDGATFNTATETLPLTLNGHTLTKTGSSTLLFRRPYSTNEGTVDIQTGTLIFTDWSNANAAYGESCVSNIALIVRTETAVVNEMKYGSSSYTLYFKSLDVRGSTMASSYGAFGVWETLSGHGSIAKLAMADGAVYCPDGADYLNVTESLPDTLKVDISNPAVAGKMKILLLKVPVALKETADAAFDLTALPPGWELKSKEIGGDVEYWLKNRRFTVIIR